MKLVAPLAVVGAGGGLGYLLSLWETAQKAIFIGVMTCILACLALACLALVMLAVEHAMKAWKESA